MESNTLASMESGDLSRYPKSKSTSAILIAQKMIAELLGTYILIFVGCGSVVANYLYDGAVTFIGISITWGITVTALVYTLGHVSGAHFNPAVTLTLAVFRHFPLKQVIFYMLAQLAGSLLASWTLDAVFDIPKQAYFGTLPSGSNGQAVSMEILASFMLMFVILGATTDDRSNGQFGGIVVGMMVTVDVVVAGHVSGASMNPARSMGPAIVKHEYRGLWTYIVGPFVGMLVAGVVYSFLRYENRPFAGLIENNSKDNESTY